MGTGFTLRCHSSLDICTHKAPRRGIGKALESFDVIGKKLNNYIKSIGPKNNEV